MLNIKFDKNDLKLEIKNNNKLSDEEKNDITEYVTFKIFIRKI
jgi:hypothetical protein